MVNNEATYLSLDIVNALLPGNHKINIEKYMMVLYTTIAFHDGRAKERRYYTRIKHHQDETLTF